VLGDVRSFTGKTVVFAGGEQEFDVVVAATDFSSGLARFLDAPRALDERGYPRADNAFPGLFFAGYSETPRGQLFESSRGAQKLAEKVDAYLERSKTQ
jgi:hypothetical protein